MNQPSVIHHTKGRPRVKTTKVSLKLGTKYVSPDGRPVGEVDYRDLVPVPDGTVVHVTVLLETEVGHHQLFFDTPDDVVEWCTDVMKNVTDEVQELKRHVKEDA